MARLHPSHHGAGQPAALDRQRTARKKKPYKIVLEAVTQEKRKLQSILSYHDQAPPGFGYIPVGYPEFTEWCKEQCRQRNLDVHIVSAKPKNRAHADPEKISSHVHRVGHHFPVEIIELACKKFGYQFTERNGLQKQKESLMTHGPDYFERAFADYKERQQLQGRPATETETKHHIAGAVRDLFPKIPEADLNSIVNHAFEEGTNRVGNAKELSLARRVQLAVVAHIRHTYTQYDDILKTGSWTEARQKVEHVSLAKLKEWRDEVGETNNELEETFREVIVLDDDEGSSDEEILPDADEREPSMEIVSSRATARDLQPEPFDRASGYAPYVSGAPRRTIILKPIPIRSKYPVNPRPSVTHTASQAPRAETRVLSPATSLGPPMYRQESLRLAPSRPIDSAGAPIVRDAYPKQMRGSDGRLYDVSSLSAVMSKAHSKLQPIQEPRTDQRMRLIEGPMRLSYDQPPSTVTRAGREERSQPPPRLKSVEGGHPSRPILAPSSRRASDQDVVLPSIEREPESESSPRRATDAPHLLRPSRNSVSMSHSIVQSPKRKNFPETAHSSHERYPEQTAKRLRPVYESEAYTRIMPAQTGLPRTYGYQSSEPSSRSRVHHHGEIVDLTSSPVRPPYRGEIEGYEAPRSRATTALTNDSYVLSPHGSPMGDMRGAYRDVSVRKPLRVHVPEHEDVRIPLPVNRAALREEAPRFETEGRHYRSGADHSRHKPY